MLVDEADGAVRWLHGLGMRYRLMYERQAYEAADGRLVFFGGLHVGNVDGGVGLMADHTRIAERLGVEVRYGTRATDLVTDGGRVVGVRAAGTDGPVEVVARFRRARRRRVRGRCRAAPPAPRPGLGARPGAGHPAQHRRHDRRGDAHRRGDQRRLGRAPTASSGMPTTGARPATASSPTA